MYCTRYWAFVSVVVIFGILLTAVAVSQYAAVLLLLYILVFGIHFSLVSLGKPPLSGSKESTQSTTVRKSSRFHESNRINRTGWGFSITTVKSFAFLVVSGKRPNTDYSCPFGKRKGAAHPVQAVCMRVTVFKGYLAGSSRFQPSR